MAKKDKRRKVTPAIIRKMKELRKEGLSYEKIGKSLDVATMTVYNYLKKEKRVGFFERLKRKLGSSKRTLRYLLFLGSLISWIWALLTLVLYYSRAARIVINAGEVYIKGIPFIQILSAFVIAGLLSIIGQLITLKEKGSVSKSGDEPMDPGP